MMRISTIYRLFCAAGNFSRFRSSETGSFTLESTYVFPFVLICTFAVVFFSLIVYERSELYHSAAETAERAAYVWPDSHKDAVTGAFAAGESDGLYWRMTGDSLADLLPFGSDGDPAEVAVPSSAGADTDSLPERKLARSAEAVPSGIAGSLTYSNRLFEREVSATFGKTVGVPSFLRGLVGDGSTAAQGRSFVVEPAEFIRTVDVTRTFLAQLKSGFSSTTASEVQQNAEKKAAETVVIRSEAEAKAYLQKLLNAGPVTVQTSYGERQIDALDRDGIMHEAKYTVNSTEAREQIRKDLELVRAGAVKGVVWHFFRVERIGKVGLSDSLKRELERNGIVVIIHN